MLFRIYSILERLNRNADKNGDFFTVLGEENGNLNAGAENKGKRVRVHSDNAVDEAFTFIREITSIQLS